MMVVEIFKIILSKPNDVLIYKKNWKKVKNWKKKKKSTHLFSVNQIEQFAMFS